MWGLDDCCSCCKTNDRFAYDQVTNKKISCSFPTQQSNACSDDDDGTIIASISDRLNLLATVKASFLFLGSCVTLGGVFLIKRYSTDLQMDSQAVKAAERCTDLVNSGRPPSSVAAAVVYIIAQLSYEKKLLKDIKEATGVRENTIRGTYEDLYPYLPRIVPTWFANANDLKKLHSP